MWNILDDLSRLIADALKFDDPGSCQSLASYGFSHTEDHTKLEAWKTVFSAVAQRVGGSTGAFQVSVQQVLTAANTAAREARCMVAYPPIAVGDIARGLVNRRFLLRESRVLADVPNAWKENVQTPGCYRKLTNGQDEESVLSSLFRGLAVSLFSSQPRTCDYSLPYREAYSTTTIAREENLYVLPHLEALSQRFVAAATRLDISDPHVLAVSSKEDTIVLSLDFLKQFLDNELRKNVSPQQVDVVVWFLRFFTPHVRPFILKGGTEGGGDGQIGGAVPPFRVLKISRGHKLDHNAKLDEDDKASIMAKVADRMLTSRLENLVTTIHRVEEEAKQRLREGDRDAARLCLMRKRDLTEKTQEVRTLQLKIDESRAIRDNQASLQVVTAALETSVKASKQILDPDRVADVMEELVEQQLIEKETNALFESTATSADLNVEGELEALELQALEDKLAAAPIPPVGVSIPSTRSVPNTVGNVAKSVSHQRHFAEGL